MVQEIPSKEESTKVMKELMPSILAHGLFMNYLKVRCFFLVDKIGLCWGV